MFTFGQQWAVLTEATAEINCSLQTFVWMFVKIFNRYKEQQNYISSYIVIVHKTQAEFKVHG